jgi:hypothetical protein
MSHSCTDVFTLSRQIFRRRKSSFGGPEVESRIAESGLYSGCWMTSAFILSMMSAVTRATCRRALWSERTSLERSSLTLYICDVTSNCCSSPVKINWQALGPVESQEPRWLFFSCWRQTFEFYFWLLGMTCSSIAECFYTSVNFPVADNRCRHIESLLFSKCY